MNGPSSERLTYRITPDDFFEFVNDPTTSPTFSLGTLILSGTSRLHPLYPSIQQSVMATAFAGQFAPKSLGAED